MPNLAVLRCKQCGFYAADLGEWTYPYDGKDYHADARDVTNPLTLPPYVIHRVERIAQIAPRGRAIDLGCGLGWTAAAMAQAGFDTYGVDESASAIDELRRNHPHVHWYCAGIEEFLQQGLQYDVISLFHVLEHIPMPRRVAERIVRSLSPGGLLVVEVPDVSGGNALLHGWKWKYWVPHHVNYFNRRTLRCLFEPFGLKLLQVEYKYHLGFPQGVWWRDLYHSTLANCGLHDIITSYWRKSE